MEKTLHKRKRANPKDKSIYNHIINKYPEIGFDQDVQKKICTLFFQRWCDKVMAGEYVCVPALKELILFKKAQGINNIARTAKYGTLRTFNYEYSVNAMLTNKMYQRTVRSITLTKSLKDYIKNKIDKEFINLPNKIPHGN